MGPSGGPCEFVPGAGALSFQLDGPTAVQKYHSTVYKTVDVAVQRMKRTHANPGLWTLGLLMRHPQSGPLLGNE
jgi:hypothetical protein